MFLRTKYETYEVLAIFAKQIQVKLNNKLAGIRSDHEPECENSKVEEFCAKNEINHFISLRTPQNNEVVEKMTGP